jgi:5-methylcytosine-specific restriction enzyme A
MAMAVPRTCPVPKCGRTNCQLHPAVAWRPRSAVPIPRIRGRKLQQLRARLFARQPWCVRCLELGRHTRATIRDHVIPLAEGGLDDATNEQALCQPCSDTKTHDESARGVHRSSFGRG